MQGRYQIFSSVLHASLGAVLHEVHGVPYLSLLGAAPTLSLAILGELSVLLQSRVATLSKFFLLLRLLPASQALIRISRPEQLEPSTGKAKGTYSGGNRTNVYHLARLLHEGNTLPAYSVRNQRVTYTTNTTSGIKAKLFGPKTWLSILGSFMLVALFGLAINLNDGIALVAILALSLLSTLVGIGKRWSLKLQNVLHADIDVVD
ncbi:MAG: hypothetical protein Q9178_005506 [Gyalolechia marmorata]